MGAGMDWNIVLEKQTDQTKHAIEVVPRILAHPRLTADQCTRLLAQISSTLIKLEVIAASINTQDAHSSFGTVVSQLKYIWEQLSEAATARLAQFELSEAA